MTASSLATGSVQDGNAVEVSNVPNTKTFVDYIPPPSVKVPPPAKYKLAILILILVYLAEWVASLGGFPQALGAAPLLSPVSIRNKAYGLVAWIKQPRAAWARRKGNSPIVEVFACVVIILEDGFSMFDAPQAAEPASKLCQEFENAGGEDCEAVLKIEHRVDPTRTREHELWNEKISKASKHHARGLKKVEFVNPPACTAAPTSDDRAVSKMEEGTYEATADTDRNASINSSQESSCNLYEVYLTFEDIDSLNEWMTSPLRQRLMDELEPILVVPDVVQIQSKRQLPDAFTDLLVRQGSATPELPPKKWKVWWMNVIGLFFTMLWTGDVMPFYLHAWGLDQAHRRLQMFVLILIDVFLSSYVMIPLLLFLFSGWVARKENEKDTQEPWRTLNDGIQSVWIQGLLTFALYGGCLIAWAVKGRP